MVKPSPAVLRRPTNWRELFESALLESDRKLVPVRLQRATDAIMDEIEDSFLSASESERLALMAALSAMQELRRLTLGEEPQACMPTLRSSTAA
jgi:hypothetical protein